MTKVERWIRVSEFVYWENFIDIIIHSEVTCFRFTMSKRRTNFPRRQLNSENIKGAALCFLSPIVVDKCSVASCNRRCNIDEGLQRGWNEVCRTRDACDKALQGLYSKWIEMSIMNPYYESIGWISKPGLISISFFAGVQSVAFFFSAIGTQGPKKAPKKIKKTTRG